MAQCYDIHRREVPPYKTGDKLWLNGQKMTINHPMKKLYHKWLSTYSVAKAISWNAYRLKLPSYFSHVHPVFSITLLRS